MTRAAVLFTVSVMVGCRGPAVRVESPPPRPTPPAVAELPAVTPTGIEPVSAKLPVTDPAGPHPSAADAKQFRGLTATACRDLAMQQSTTGNLYDAEADRPTVVPGKRHSCGGGSDEVLREARRHAAEDARNKSAAEALDRFYQLAEAEAKADLLVRALAAFDSLRREAPRLRAAGLPVPTDEEFMRQRAKMLLDAEQAEASVKLLNIDLKARLGLPGGGADRLWPTGDFGVTADTLDAEGIVQTALADRPDLRLVRGLYLGLTTETLSAAREQLGIPAGTTSVPRLGLLGRRNPSTAVAEQLELETRKRQLFESAAGREKQAAAEVRAAVVSVASAARRVGLAKARAESWATKLADLKAKGGKPAEVLQAELEWYKERAEVIGEVFNYHRARAKLGLAVGHIE